METKEEKMEQGVTHLRPGRRTPVLSLHLRGGTRVAEPVPTQQRAGSYVHRAAERRSSRKLGFRLTEFSEIYSRFPSLIESATSPRMSSSPVNACCRLLPQLEDTAHA